MIKAQNIIYKGLLHKTYFVIFVGIWLIKPVLYRKSTFVILLGFWLIKPFLYISKTPDVHKIYPSL